MSLRQALELHVPEGAAEAEDVAYVLSFLDGHSEPFDRRIPEGHLTASAFVVADSGGSVLLLHHRKLGRWLQPGGHADPGECSGEAIALREAREETGIQGLALHATAPRPLDVDVHAIPARGEEPAHQHLDLRYLVLAPQQAALSRCAAEASELRWFSWTELDGLDLDPGLCRGLRKVRLLLGP